VAGLRGERERAFPRLAWSLSLLFSFFKSSFCSNKMLWLCSSPTQSASSSSSCASSCALVTRGMDLRL